MKKYNYVYKIINHNPQDQRKYYIGVRSSKLKPSDDTKYWSSSKYIKQAIKEYGQENFTKEILSIWESREEAMLEEIRLHKKYNVSSDPIFYNKANSKSTGFSPEGRVVVKNKSTNSYESVTSEEYFNNKDLYENNFSNNVQAFDTYTQRNCIVTKNCFDSSDRYVGINIGKLAVIENNIGKQVSLEEYYSNPNYKIHTEGTILVRDKVDGISKRIRREDFDNDVENRYMSYFKNQIMSKDLESGENKFVMPEEFIMNDNLVGVSKDRITVVNNKTDGYENITLEKYNLNKDLYTFHLSGKVVAIDANGMDNWVSKEEFDLSDDLVGRNKGKIPARNRETGKQELVTKDEFYNSGKFEALSKNGVMVRVKSTGKTKRIAKDEFDKNNELYEGINTGFSNAFDISTRTMRRVSKDEFKNNANLINNQSNFYRIFDENGIEHYLLFGNISKWCKDNGAPFSVFQNSSKNNGAKIYHKTTEKQDKLISLKGWNKFRNWSVIKGKVVELVEKNV